MERTPASTPLKNGESSLNLVFDASRRANDAAGSSSSGGGLSKERDATSLDGSDARSAKGKQAHVNENVRLHERFWWPYAVACSS